MENKEIRLGIFGLNRGGAFFPALTYENVKVVAVCEKKQTHIENARNKLGYDFAVYDDFDRFIEHDMDAVLLANCFDQHAPYAIRLLEKGISVLSETQSNVTMADGVSLVRAAEKSRATYMLLENYPFMLFNQEMKKIADGKTLGKILYAEGEYNHPGPPKNADGTKWLTPTEKHWRRYLPRTYYLTHALSPLMYITGAFPKKVTALPIFAPSETAHSYIGDIAACMTTLNDDDSVFRFFGHSSFGYEEHSYRFCGQNGQVENVRGTDGMIMLNYNAWSVPEGKGAKNFYMPVITGEEKSVAEQVGHFYGDFYVIRAFCDTLRGKRKNPFDVYFATTLASVAILAHRSVLDGGKPYDIPDFRKEEDRVKYENDTATPFWGENGEAPTVPCCSHPDYRPTKEAVDWFMNTISTDPIR